MSELRPCPRGGAVSVCVAFLVAALAASAHAASVSDRSAPFQTCLDGQLEKWVKARAELVVNEDPKAGDIDDAVVATWAIATLDACRAQAGGGDQATEAAFTKRVAHWREHIYERVQSIRELARPD
jgi:hypothetical protein